MTGTAATGTVVAETTLIDNTVVLVLLFAVAAGAGASARYLASGYLNGDFPLGTLVVNVVASLFLGVVVAADDPLPTVIGIGAIGALSTWSVTATEVAAMARSGRGALALSYLGLTASSGVLAAWFGLKLGQAIF